MMDDDGLWMMIDDHDGDGDDDENDDDEEEEEEGWQMTDDG